MQNGSPIEGMTKGEKRELMADMFRYKNCFIDQNLEKYFPTVPKTDTEYLSIMKRVSQSMNISMEKLASNVCAEFNSTLKNIEDVLTKTDLSQLEEISLTMPQSEFIKRVEKFLENLPISEQYKIKEFYGFDIKNSKLSGYPDNYGRNIDVSEISDASSLKVAKEIENIIEEYKNNNYITVNDCPPLNNALKNISKLMPEMFNQIDGSNLSVKMLKSLQTIIKNPKYVSLSDSDKKVLTFATLLHNTDKDFGNATDSAFDAFFIAQKFGFSPDEAKKVYLIVQSSDVIEKFMGTNKNIVSKNLRGFNQSTTNRQNTFDRLAFDLRESNTFELAQMLYSAKDKDGLTRYLDKMLETRIKEMKSSDFVLPQTSTYTYAQYSTKRNVKEHDVDVIKLSDLNDFYAFIHTPECSFATGGMSRNQKFANFEAFSSISDDKIICTSYISKDKICGAADHGFIFDVPNEKQFVGMGFDIYSLGKNINDMLTEYFDTKSKIMAYGGRGEKMSHRTMISDNLKQILNISDDEYIKRLDNIKSKFAGETMTIEKLNKVDSDFANAYKEFLSRDNTRGARNKDALLRNGGWNEVLVSNPKISAIFTRDIDNIPEEYLIKAQTENLPIIILNE